MSGHITARPHDGTEFHGQGIQNTGSINVGRDVNIGLRDIDIDTDTLQKVRLTDPRDDKTRIEQQKGGLLQDSYKWILSHKDFQRWRDGEESQLLWIKGDPGKGKTMLLCGIIDELNKEGKSSRNIVYYFCQATNKQLRKATYVLRGLIFSLLSQQRSLLGIVREEIDLASGETFKDLNGWAALCRIFNRLIEETERLGQTTYLIVDALDECLEDQHYLLRWIVDLSLTRVKVLVSSRNWHSVENGLSIAKQRVLLQLELNADSISAAVDRYIEYKTVQLAASKHLDAESEIAVQKHLKSNSNNTFLWVALVCQNLGHNDTVSWKVDDMLQEFPPGLDELYERMAGQFLSSEHAELCRQILVIQALAYRPLNLTELLPLVESPEIFPKVTKWLPEVVKLCGSFLTIRDDTLYFVHQSAKDYLIQHLSNSIFRRGILAGHRTMAVQSIQALDQTLQENMYQLPSPEFFRDGIDVPNPDPLNGIRYACVYWADHLEDSRPTEKQDLEDDGLVHRFLEQHLLHWFEALSLLKSLGSGIEALTKVSTLLREIGKGEQGLHKLIYDAQRFLRQHKIGIETAPLQVYSSALVFSPTHSVVRKLYLKKPDWLLISPTRGSSWGACLQTLEGHVQTVESIVFSPDGRYVASGSWDCTARIWDVATGGCLNILKGHRDGIDSMAVSPNGEYIASSSSDCTIRIWNAKTGLCLQTLGDSDKHSSWLVAFLDNESIISINNYVKVCAWNIATGQCLETVQTGHSIDNIGGFSKKLHGLCLSRNGRRNPLLDSGHLYTPERVALSPDGKLFVFPVSDFIFQIWDTMKNKRMSIIKMKSDPSAMAFSPDNKHLLTSQFQFSIITTTSTAWIHIPPGALSGIGVSLKKDWILRNNRPYLWVPPEYRNYERGTAGFAS
ncbi:hypothetical protein F5Y12DRAFT_788515 [Xylaria sp. FL1777]|nr:hypothetical protein F5Y12DRAFT_788515 [Xylaria sp. FL1777]